MPVTSPDSIYYADGSTPIAIETITAAMATSVQDAFNSRIVNRRQIQTFVWANAAARTAQTGMIAGDFGYQTDTGLTYRYNGSSWVVAYSSGLTNAIATSVSGTGVARDSVTGAITLTNATAVTVNGVFTSAFRAYEINYDTNGTAAGVTLQLRASGTTSTTGYDLTENLARNAVTSSSTVLNQASWALSAGTNTRHAGGLRIFAPQVAVETALIANTGVHANPAVSSVANGSKVSFATHRTAAAYDGFVLTFSAAQSGSLRIRAFA
ncbi:hypothetical protein Pan2_22 [Pseudanabaena phage Pan2]|nr:hypothetical protein Pan2_22 [Pseudanabaena phage Pan2]